MATSIKYIVAALIVVMLAALLGWYFFLKGERTTIEEDSLARGSAEAVPFGTGIGSTYENIVSSVTSVVGGAAQKKEGGKPPRLSRIGKAPVAGYAFIEKNGKNQLRFVERGSGYVFDAAVDGGELERITNTLVPRTYEALVAHNHIVLRGIEERGVITTLLADITSTSTAAAPVPLKSRRLPDDIHAIALDASGSTLFYVVESRSGGKGIRSSWNGDNEKEIFSSTITGWQMHVLEKGELLLTQNAEDGIIGNVYRAKTTLEPIVRNVQGLTFLPHPRLPAYLYGESAGGGPSLFARSNATSSLIALPVRTIADKCIWGPRELVAYCAVPHELPPPDFLGRWYRGEIHTSDQWWSIDVRANAAEQLYSSANAAFDVEDPVIDPGGNYIAFRNANDKTLWLLRIAE